MKTYISNILPRLVQFSESLSRQEIYIDKPWVMIDEAQNFYKYIFKRNGELVMSFNGQVTIGSWEYLAVAGSLLINRIHDKILLNQNFIDPAVMILKQDGFNKDNFVLINQLLIPDFDVDTYLKKLYHSRNQIVIKKLTSGLELEILGFDEFYYNKKVSVEGNPIEDDTYELQEPHFLLEIRDSRVAKVINPTKYTVKQGVLTIYQQQFYNPFKGNSVFLNQEPAPDDTYRLSFFSKIKVKDGIIQ